MAELLGRRTADHIATLIKIVRVFFERYHIERSKLRRMAKRNAVEMDPSHTNQMSQQGMLVTYIAFGEHILPVGGDGL